MEEILGYWEYIKIPGVTKKSIKAKCDTGATISSLHAEDIELYKKNKLKFVRFKINKDSEFVSLRVIEMRQVRSSNGDTQIRPVVMIPIEIGKNIYSIDCTLSDRTPMAFPMLLGRSALAGRYLIDSNSICQSRKKRK
jgi:ribosomal protein S6--L-glutamate ligase